MKSICLKSARIVIEILRKYIQIVANVTDRDKLSWKDQIKLFKLQLTNLLYMNNVINVRVVGKSLQVIKNVPFVNKKKSIKKRETEEDQDHQVLHLVVEKVYNSRYINIDKRAFTEIHHILFCNSVLFNYK